VLTVKINHRNWLTAAMLFVLLAGTQSVTKAYASGQNAQGSTIDADGDDERTELLYHWQDKHFYNEERHQLLTCSLLIGGVFFGGVALKQAKRRRWIK
jgi:hypothetical protein